MKVIPWIGGTLLIFLGVFATAANREFDPHWRVGDTWKVRVTYPMSTSGQKVVGREFDDLIKTTKLVYPYPQLFDYEVRTVEWRYRVERMDTEGIAEIEVTGPTTGRYAEVQDRRLYFETNTMVLKRIDRMSEQDTRDFRRSDIKRDDCYFADGSACSMDHFVRIPESGEAQSNVCFLLGMSTPVFQVSVPDATGVTLTMTKTNNLDGLDRKVTIRWEKGNKWWSSAKEELGTNLVKSAVLIE